MGSNRGCFRVPFAEWFGFHGLMHDPPPPPYWKRCFRSPFRGWCRGFVQLGFFFVGKRIFTYFFISVLWLGWGVFQGWLVSRLFGLGGGLGLVLVFGVLVDGV